MMASRRTLALLVVTVALLAAFAEARPKQRKSNFKSRTSRRTMLSGCDALLRQLEADVAWLNTETGFTWTINADINVGKRRRRRNARQPTKYVVKSPIGTMYEATCKNKRFQYTTPKSPLTFLWTYGITAPPIVSSKFGPIPDKNWLAWRPFIHDGDILMDNTTGSVAYTVDNTLGLCDSYIRRVDGDFTVAGPDVTAKACFPYLTLVEDDFRVLHYWCQLQSDSCCERESCSTTYAPEPPFQFEYESNEDVFLLPMLKWVGDDVRIDFMEDFDVFEMPNLEYIGGDLEIYDSAISIISFPNLVEVDDFAFADDSFQTFSFPKLQEINDKFYMKYIADLQTTELPELRYVKEEFFFGDNPNATVLSAPKLVLIREEFEVSACPVLQTIMFPLLRSSEEFIIGQLGDPTNVLPLQLNFDSFEAVSDQFDIYDIEHDFNVSFPSLLYVFRDFLFSQNPKLLEVSFPKLIAVGRDFNFYMNPLIEVLDFPKLEHIGTGNFDLRSNNFKNVSFDELEWIYSQQTNLVMTSDVVEFYFPKLLGFRDWSPCDTSVIVEVPAPIAGGGGDPSKLFPLMECRGTNDVYNPNATSDALYKAVENKTNCNYPVQDFFAQTYVIPYILDSGYSDFSDFSSPFNYLFVEITEGGLDPDSINFENSGDIIDRYNSTQCPSVARS